MRKIVMLIIVSCVAMTFAAIAEDSSKLAAQSMFKEMDKDGDGKVTAAEWRAYWMDQFKKGDANSDGKRSKEEAAAAADKLCEGKDVNKDGSLTKEELIGGPIPANAQAPSAKASQFEMADANGDGTISEIGFASFMVGRFQNADKNGDGKLSKDEIRLMFLDAHKEARINNDGTLDSSEFCDYWCGKGVKAADKAEKK